MKAAQNLTSRIRKASYVMLFSILKCDTFLSMISNFFSFLLPMSLTAIFIEFPVFIVEWANLPSLQPTRYAVKVKSMITYAPCHTTLFLSSRRLVGLTFYTQIHNVISTDCTRRNDNIPRP